MGDCWIRVETSSCGLAAVDLCCGGEACWEIGEMGFVDVGGEGAVRAESIT